MSLLRNLFIPLYICLCATSAAAEQIIMTCKLKLGDTTTIHMKYDNPLFGEKKIYTEGLMQNGQTFVNHRKLIINPLKYQSLILEGYSKYLGKPQIWKVQSFS